MSETGYVTVHREICELITFSFGHMEQGKRGKSYLLDDICHSGGTKVDVVVECSRVKALLRMSGGPSRDSWRQSHAWSNLPSLVIVNGFGLDGMASE